MRAGRGSGVHRGIGAVVVCVALAAVLSVLYVLPGPPQADARAHKPHPPMTAAMKTRIVKAHAAARAGCRRVARTARMRTLCGSVKPPVTAPKRLKSTSPLYQQYGFVCRPSPVQGGFWTAVAFTDTTQFRDGEQDYLIWLQFPAGLDAVPGGPAVMRIFAAVYCDVYGTWAYPTPTSTVPPPITPDVPTFSDGCGITSDRYTIPDAVPVPLFILFGPDDTAINWVDPDVGAMYLVNGVVSAPGTYRVPNGTTRIVIEAVPTTSRYVVNTPSRWERRFTNAPCDMPVDPVKPTAITPVCGPNNDVIGHVTPITGLTYDYGQWQNNQRTVTATAWDGYTIPGDSNGRVSWTFTDADTPCPISVTTTAPTVREFCGPRNDVITVATTTGVVYTVSPWQADGTLTVSATPQPGYVISAGSGIEWKVTDAARTCPIVDPPLPPTRLTIRMTGPTVRNATKSVTYGFYIRNVGKSTARNVVLKDPIPTGMVLLHRPVDGTLRKGAIVWKIGDLQPGQWIYLNATLKSVKNADLRRCQRVWTAAKNAPYVRTSRCTRFVRVLGGTFPGGVAG